MPQILRSLVINQSQKLSIFFENQINMNDCSILMLFIFLPQIRIFSIKYIEKLEGVSVGGRAGGSAGAVSLVTICIKFTGWWVHYSHYGAAATRRTHVTVVTSGDTWHVTRDTWRHHPWDTEAVTMDNTNMTTDFAVCSAVPQGGLGFWESETCVMYLNPTSFASHMAT